jgi:micrococcal nuclease
MHLKRLFIFILVISLLGILAYFYPEPSGHVVKNYGQEEAVLLRVIDGDTIEVTGPEIGEKTHVRLLGINTPEKNMPFSNESKKFLSQFVNKTIILERDFEDTDKYDRKLRYLLYNEDLINTQILESGFANSYYTPGLKYEKELLNAESQAKNLGIGIWTHSNEKCSSCIILRDLNYTSEFFTIANNCSFNCSLSGWFVKDAGRNTFYLSSLNPHAEKTYSSNNKEIWNNEGDRFFMFDKEGYLVLFYKYP